MYVFRTIFLSIIVTILNLATVRAAPHAGDWKSAEIVSFKDFDDMKETLDGKSCKVFLVGLRHLREAWENKEERQRIQKEVYAVLKEFKLFASVVTKKCDIVGLSLDSFAHNKHCFDHEWDPIQYPYYATGWGAYNFNLFFFTKYLPHSTTISVTIKPSRNFFTSWSGKKRSRDPSTE